MEYDLRVFREKGQKTLELQRKIPILAAHNPEVVGSSPASATIKKHRISKEIRCFSNFLGSNDELKNACGVSCGVSFLFVQFE